ncbi:MAG: hypothetical protein PHR61_02405 [Candidatus Absconditabacteria bacterium]|nr:hypothetical protein [Candidatus Absconditabacteria bacterium]
MNQLKELLLRHPTRSKYLLLVIDIFLILVATKMFVNYNSIKLAIEETALQSEQKKLELAFTENFQLPYERSEYAQYFLKHENNILLSKEFIIKFQTIDSTNNTGEVKEIENKNSFIESPQQSRRQFFYEKLFIKKP